MDQPLAKGDQGMAKGHRQPASAPEKKAEARVVKPISLPTAPAYELWAELAEEAGRYIRLLDELTRPASDLDAEQREKLEGELMDSLSHLRVHSQVLDESVIDALELADLLEEHELQKTS
jgi:hypothetical protein